MRDAEELAGDVFACVPVRGEPFRSEVHAAVAIIEADRRAAKLEVLREFKRRHRPGWPGATSALVDQMIASLETEAAEHAKEET